MQRVKRQQGYIFRKGNSWFLRYSDSILRNGKVVRVQLCKKLADCGGPYRYAENVRSLADEILLPINAGSQDVRSTMPVAKFIEGVYLPEVKKKQTPKHLQKLQGLHFPAPSKATARGNQSKGISLL